MSAASFAFRILARISACRCLPTLDLFYYPVRTLIDSFPATEEGRSKQMTVLQDNISWATKENRVFLRQSLEVKLVGLSVPTSWSPCLSFCEACTELFT